MKISAKLILSFAIVSIIMALVGTVGIVGLKTIDTSYSVTYEQQAMPLEYMAHVMEYTQRLRVQARNIALYHNDPEQLQIAIKDRSDRAVQYNKYLDEYSATIVNAEARKLFDEARNTYNDKYAPTVDKMQEMALAGDSLENILAVMGTANDSANLIVDNFTRCMDIKVEAGTTASDANTKQANFLLVVMLAAVILGVIVAIALGIYIASIIGRPIRKLSGLMDVLVKTGNFRLSDAESAQIAELGRYRDETGVAIHSFANLIQMLLAKCDTLDSVASGDLTTTVTQHSQNDTMGAALQKMVDNLNNMFGEINSSSNQVSTGSIQIADGAQLLAQGATEQSATVEELSASITEIAEQTRHNSGTANEARDLGESIKVSAEQGTQQMGQMMQAVQEINESSKSIGKVIKIIDDIAFQTNILALNAAVEAARAGQHGKGFAVVADEVRSLAAKSAEAAKNTNELIESSIKKAELGAAISEETSHSLQQIVDGILRSSELISQIAKSSAEQSIAISQVSDGIEQVSQVVQQNSATAEQSAAASEEMSGQATLLQQLIAQFKLKESAGSGMRSIDSSTSAARISIPQSTGYAIDNTGKY